MIFGIPRELKDHETRVGAGLIPRNVATLIAQGHTVYFQKGVMEPAGVSDEEFLKVPHEIICESMLTNQRYFPIYLSLIHI